MAELLSCLLSSPGQLPDLAREEPPPGMEAAVWALRHELPLHLINFLRDQTEPLLAVSQGAQPTPNKGSAVRPSKYQYSSPLKSVVESPGKASPKKPEWARKTKKKVKLFSSQAVAATKGHKSFSEVEENLTNNLEGIDKLPSTPNRSMQGLNSSGNSSRAKYNSSNLSDQDTPPERGLGSAGSKIAKRISSRFTPSPQAFSLSDFLTPAESKRAGKKGSKSCRSPAKMKASTPIDDSTAPDTLGERELPKVSNLNERLAELDLGSQDAFPEIGETRRRRIKPIQLCQVAGGGEGSSTAFGRVVERQGSTESPFKVEEVERRTVDDREMVKESISRKTPLKVSAMPAVTPLKPGLSRSSSICGAGVVACPLLVTHRPQLLVLSSLYSYILLHNLMPNLIVEIYFLMELLLIDVPVDQDPLLHQDEDRIFSSVHNCVFFSSLSLGRAAPLLCPLDTTALRLLTENCRLQEFCPGAHETLAALLHTRSSSSPTRPRSMSRSLQNVSFQSETDNRSNFPSNQSFHDFKKQRDKFYSLLRRWGEESRGPDYEFTQLAGEVESVMTMYDHPVNYAHFARLFRQQLVAMCQGEGGGDIDEKVMSELRRADPTKYKRLAARLTTPGRSGGPCPGPAFTGAQEFFRDFLASCRSPQFLHHLQDSLATEIRRLDSLPLEVGARGLSRLDDTAQMELSQDGGDDLAEQYQGVLGTLRMLGKFLGFLEARSYSCEDTLSEELQEALLSTRACQPVLSLSCHLAEASSRGRLLLTLPWIVELLTQLDQVSMALPAYRSLLLALAVLYQTSLSPGSPTILPLSASLLSLLLGWLFEARHFPRDLLILARLQPGPSPSLVTDTLDLAEVVGQELVLQCCPWVGELRSLLQRWEGSRRGSQLSLDRLEGGSKASYRKITPVAAPSDRRPEDQGAILQATLEKSFFHNQPGAVRRTVDFLTERLASNIIRTVRTQLVSEERQEAVSSLQQLLDSQAPGGPLDSQEPGGSRDSQAPGGSRDRSLAALLAAVPGLAQGSLARIRASPGLYSTLQSDSEAGLSLLLSSDTSPAVRAACREVTARVVGERVRQYLAQHLTLQYFTREYRCEAERLFRAGAREPAGTAPLLEQHQPQAAPPSHSLIQMKQQLVELLLPAREQPHLTEQSLMDLLAQVLTCLYCRADLTPAASKGLSSLSLDWLLGIATHRPELLTSPVLEAALELWKVLPPPQLLSLVCPRNLVLLDHSPRPQESWQAMGRLLSLLLDSSLLPSLALEDSCLALQDLARDSVQATPPGHTLEWLHSCLAVLAVDRESLAWVEELFPGEPEPGLEGDTGPTL